LETENGLQKVLNVINRNAYNCVNDFSKFFDESLDFSPESLKIMDKVVNANWPEERFEEVNEGKEDEILVRIFETMTIRLGCYFGEVLVRNLDGRWKRSNVEHMDHWIVDIDDRLKVNVFHIIRDCFVEPSKLHFVFRMAKEKKDETSNI
jgi:hypothetical protein